MEKKLEKDSNTLRKYLQVVNEFIYSVFIETVASSVFSSVKLVSGPVCVATSDVFASLSGLLCKLCISMMKEICGLVIPSLQINF